MFSKKKDGAETFLADSLEKVFDKVLNLEILYVGGVC
jgi:hypothetical protein